MKLNQLLLAFLLGFVILTAACKKNENNSQETILPGEGLTSVKIGDKAQVALDAFGAVSPSSSVYNGVYAYSLQYVGKGIIVFMEPTTVATFNSDMTCNNIQLVPPFEGKTEKDIGIGSTKAEVKTAYGEPDSPNSFSGDQYSIGIVFKYDNHDVVEEIQVIKKF